MNRRDFLRSSILLPTLASLLPVLARTPQPLAAPLAVELPDEGFAVLSRIEHHFDGPGIPDRTRLEYKGTYERLKELARLFSQRDIISAHFTQTVESIQDECGFTVGIITFDWSELSVLLRGCWIGDPGIVERGKTGLCDMHWQ